MKKIFYILVSAIVALGAVACNNEIDENIEANNGGGVSFTVALDDEASRIIIGERDAENKHTISFVEGDVIYAENGSLKPFEFVCDEDNVTFYCNEPNADGKLPAEMVGQKLNFYTNKVAQAWKGANGINLKANGVTFNNNGDVITLSLGSPVLAFTSPYDVVLKMSRPAFLTESNQYVDEMTFAAQEGTTYVPFLDAGLVTFSYLINGETIKTIEKDFETKVYNIGNLTLAVAQVNGVNYTELSKAIEKVEDGGTITLVADYCVEEETPAAVEIPAGKTVNIDLGGYKFTMVGANAIKNSGILNITNGAIESTTTYAINAQEGSETTIEGVEVTGGLYLSKGIMTVKNGKVYQQNSGRHGIYNGAGELVVENGEFDSISGNELILADGENAKVTINGGTFKKTGKSYLFSAAADKNINFVINGGVFYGYVNESDSSVDPIRPNAAIKIVGGSFNFDPTNWIDVNTYKATLNEESKLYDVAKKVPVAGIGEMQYETLAEAFEAAAKTGAPVTVAIEPGTYTSFPAVKLAENVTIDATDVVFDAATTTTFSLNVNGATIKGATFSGKGNNDNLAYGDIDGTFIDCHFIAEGFGGLRYLEAPAAGKTTQFINCIFEGKVCYAVHINSGKGGDVLFDGCEFYGFNTFGKGVNQLTIKNSKFGYIGNSYGYNGINMHGNTTLENVDFVFDGQATTEWFDPLKEECTYIMNGVTINGQPITYIDVDCSPVSVTIDGVLYEGVVDGVVLVNGVYEIYKPAGMTWFSKEINVNKNTFAGKTVKVVADIDMNGVEYLGGSIASYPSYSFAGTFDGGNKTISNLTISVEGDTYGAAALIPTITGKAVIKDVILKDVNISSSHYAAGIWGYMSTGSGSDIYEATVTNCHVDGGTITGNLYNGDNADKIGGIGGIFYNGEVSGCSVKNVTLSGYRDMAGIVGWANDEDAVVKNNTIENVTLNVNNTNNYKSHLIQDDYDVNNYVGEGDAATIEGNSGEATINWNGVPEYVVQVKGQNFKTLADAMKVAEDGDIVKLAAGEFELPNINGKTMTFVGAGADKTSINFVDKLFNSNGAVYYFENIKMLRGKSDYFGIQHSAGEHYKKCSIDGTLWLYAAENTFEECVFTIAGNAYNVWTYGGLNVTFTKSEFHSEGKSMLIYNEGHNGTKATFEECKFYSGGNKFDGKAAIEIDSSLLADDMLYEVAINGCTVEGFDAGSVSNNNLFNPKKGSKHIITVNGAEYVADGVWKTAEGNYTLASKAAMFWFANEVNANGNTFAGKTVTVVENIDLNNEAWVPVGNKGTTQFEGTFDGGNKTISNLNIVDLNNTAGHAVGMFGQIHNAAAQIKNIKIAGVHVEGLHYVAPIVGYLSGGSDITNCHVDGATIIAYPYLPDSNLEFNGDKLGGIAGYAEEGSVVSQCSVKNTTITGYRDMGGIVGACVATAKVIDNTIGANVKIVVDNSNNYKPLTLQSEYNIASYVGKPANGAVVSGNGEVVIEWGDIRARGYRVYVTAQPKSAAAEWSKVFVYTWDANGNNNAWNGKEVTANTEVINGYTYNYYEYSTEWDGRTVNVIANNGNQQTADIVLGTLDKDYYVVYSTAMHEVYTTAPAAGSIPEYVAPAEDTVLYLVPNANWKMDNARFAAYFFGNGDTWDSMTDEDGDGVYEVVVPEGYTNVIFCRMKPDATANNWDNKWDQTVDLDIPTDGKNLFTVKDGEWNGANGTWSTKQ